MYREDHLAALLIMDTLRADIRALEDALTVGNYFERIDIINQKKAQLAELQSR